MDTTQKKVSGPCSEVTNSLRSNQEETLTPTGEMPLDKHGGSDQNEIEKDIHRQQSPDVNFSSELSSQLKCQGNGGGSPKAKEEIEAEQDECAADEKYGSNQNKSGHCNVNQRGGVILANEVASSTGLNQPESEEPSPGSGAHREVDENCLEENNKWNQNEYGHFPGKQTGVPGYSDEVASSRELHHCREETFPVGGSLCELDENRNCLEQDNETEQIESGDCKREWPGDVKLSDEVSSSTELTCQEIEDLSPMVGTITELDKNPKSCFIPGSSPDNAREQIEFEDFKEEWPGNLKLPNEVSSSSELTCQEIEDSAPGGTNTGLNDNPKSCFMPGDELSSSTELTSPEIEESSPMVGTNTGLNENYKSCFISGSSTDHEREQIEFEDCKRECPEDVKLLNEVSSSTELTCQEIEDSSPMVPTVGTNTGLDKNLKSCSISGSSTAKDLLVLDMMDSENTAQRSSGESIITDNLMSPHIEQPEQSEKRTSTSALDHMRSGDASDNIAITNPLSGFSATLQDLPKSPTTRSSNAYDGSVSSYDGTDDQIPRKHLHLSSRQVMKAGYLDARMTPRSRRGELTPKITSGHAEKQHNAWAASSISLENKKHAMKGRKWNRDDFLEARRHAHTIRSRMNFETHEHLPRVPLHLRSPLVDYENGNPSSYGRSAFVCSTSLHPPNATEYPEQEKMELLKMVYELQDQLKKVLISKEKANGRYPGVTGKGKQVPSYYTSLSPESEMMYDGLCCANYPRRCHHGKFCPCQSRTSLQPFSAEATIGRCQGEHSCFHCRPQDWRYSAPLPPHNVYMKSHCTTHPSPRYHSLYAYSPSSPRHYVGSECSLQSYDARSDNHSHMHHEEKGYYEERHNLVKRHVRPVSGGAPFIVCYHCGELLHLPADSLLFNRRYHQLKCGVCSRVLKFSFQNRARIVPYTEYTPSARAPPPSEVDYPGDAANGGALASASYVPNADLVSCSDDYGSSFCKSGSTEGEISAALPSHTHETYSNDRRISSCSSLDHIKERKRPVFRESLNRYWDPVQTFDGPSSSKAGKLSSEIEELPRASSPLYRLMEYSSPREVMNS
ncbi:uncharacterized protein LOC127797592 isoform X2 [Diospyros lotus]|nr:uncharacterized protein LOC127797592 isoform X2 [Diospyros lotus]